MRVIDLPEFGLKLIRSQDPSFDMLLRTSLGGEATPELDVLKPYTAILQNNSSNVLVAYSVRWEYTRPDGRLVHVDYSDGQIGRLLDGAVSRPITAYDEGSAMLYPHFHCRNAHNDPQTGSWVSRQGKRLELRDAPPEVVEPIQ
ncbi:MAG TPA: hypothetical protein VMP68_14440 [Candidatus Eisenbacteria bacterium]|nr:hypothetical protein [Candidatus Eisenbacteria bacterium]